MLLKKIKINMLMLFVLAGLLNAYPGKVVKKYPAPGKFCTGLTFDGRHLWLADYKADKIFKINPADGKTISSIPSPGFWPLGLAWDGKYLWNVDKIQKKIFQIDPQNGRIVNVLEAPGVQPQGLTWDGQTLWLSDSKKNRIYQLDLSDGTAVKRFDAPAKRVQGLTFDGKYLRCTDRYKDELYMVDPANGEVLLVADAPGPYARGLAWDGKFLWNVDYQSDSLCQIIRQDDENYRLTKTRSTQVTFTHQVKVYGHGEMKSLDTYIAIPENLAQQKIKQISFSTKNFLRKQDHWNQPIAVFNYQNIGSNKTVESVMTVDAEISAIRYFIFPDKAGKKLTDIPSKILRLYTTNGSKYKTDDPYIRDLAKNIVGDEIRPYWIARKIFNYVRKHLEYKLEGGWNVAPVVLQRGTGSCSEYTFSFIALARAAGLPARYVGAIVVRGDDASLDDVFHRWPEIYLPNYGWIPIDPQGGDKPSPRDQALAIGDLSNRFLITTQGGGDSEYLGWYYNYNQKYVLEPKVKVEIQTFGEWEPLKN